MIEINDNDIVLSFDNKTGKMIVLRTDGVCAWTDEPCALCLCIEPHPHGYEVGYEGWWCISNLTPLARSF